MRKRPEKTEQTKQDLREAFWRLYAERPIEKITVQQVCDLAGYNRGTFYLHFSDLYELLSSIEERLLAGMTACVEDCMRGLAADSSKPAKLAALASVVRFYERERRYVTVLLGERGDPAFILRLKNELKPLWRTYVIENAGERSEAEIDLLLEYTLSGTLFMISRWLTSPSDVGKAQIGRLIYDAAIRDLNERAAS